MGLFLTDSFLGQRAIGDIPPWQVLTVPSGNTDNDGPHSGKILWEAAIADWSG